MTMYAITATGYRAISGPEDVVAGEAFTTELPSELLGAIAASEVRSLRDATLRSCDWTQITDAPLAALQRAQWVTYRQALRDLPSLPGFPDVPWPVPPTLPAGAAHS